MASPTVAPQRASRNFITLLGWWFRPRSTDRDSRFRERTCRLITAVMFVAAGVTFSSSQFIFHDKWTLFSFPTLAAYILVCTAFAAISVWQGRLILTGLFLLVAWLGTPLWVAQIGYAIAADVRLAIFLVALIIGATVLPRGYIAVIALACIVLQNVNNILLQDLGAVSELVMSSTIFITGGIFLYVRGRESDDRLETMRRLYAEAEAARREADIANQERLKAMQRAVEAAESANQLKSQFLANITHDLRTPLNAILGYADIMLGGMAGEFAAKQMQLIGHIQTSGKRLLNLINNLLNLTRIESGTVDIRASTASPRKIVDDIVDSMRSLADKKNIFLKTVYLDSTPNNVVIDVEKSQQILSNLLGNALKFTEKEGVTVEIGGNTPNEWRWRIIDTGIGMPREALTYIFEKFRQVDSTDTKKYEGTGLGLAIVKSLVELLHGTISVESELGKGTIFTVTLPRVFESTAVVASKTV